MNQLQNKRIKYYNDLVESGIVKENETSKSKILNVKKNNMVFMLWGSHAKNKGKFIDRNKHLILEAVHPSPLSAYRGFIGCDHFLKANQYLDQHGLENIDWCLI